MKFEEVTKAVFETHGVVREGQLSLPQTRQRLQEQSVILPEQHQQLLGLSDGLSAYGGYFRLFGVGRSGNATLGWWNAETTWKFAWPEHVSQYLCFAETAWGDQYAYRHEDLLRGAQTVYYLESITLSPTKICDNFLEFLVNEFLRNCIHPWDEFIVGARKKIGDLKDGEHVVNVPSPLISGEESIDNLMKMPATAAMILNGDLASQLAGEEQSRPIERLEHFEDEQGRTRIRVIWA